jgi:hypothetical protein
LIGLLGFVTVIQEFLKPWLSLVSKEGRSSFYLQSPSRY